MKTKKILSMLLSSALILTAIPFNANTKTYAYDEYGWEDSYWEKINEFFKSADVNFARYEIIDVNSDGTPELFLSEGEYHYSDLLMYTFYDGEIIELDCFSGAYGVASVSKSLGTVYVSGGGQGLSWTIGFNFNGYELTEVEHYDYYFDNYPSDIQRSVGRKNDYTDLYFVYGNIEYQNMFSYAIACGLTNDKISTVTIPATANGLDVKNAELVGYEYITAVNVNSSNKYLSSSDGILYNKDKTELIFAPPAKYYGNYTVSDSVRSIGNGAFWGCDTLISIILPESIGYIGLAAFGYCENLESVTFLNKNCKIFDDNLSYDEYYMSTIISNYYHENNEIFIYNGIIKGYDNSTAKKYADICGYAFISIEPEQTTTTTTTTTTTITTTTSPPQTSRIFGDINGDGIVDASDASAILTYYAMSSTGYEGSLEDYVIELISKKN